MVCFIPLTVRSVRFTSAGFTSGNLSNPAFDVGFGPAALVAAEIEDRHLGVFGVFGGRWVL